MKKPQNIKEFWAELKKDKKKMFFVVLIPILLIGSVILGIFYQNKNSSEVVAEKTEGVIVPVADSVSIQKKNSSKTQVYQTDFFALEEEKVVEPEPVPTTPAPAPYYPPVKKNSYAYTPPSSQSESTKSTPKKIEAKSEDIKEDSSEDSRRRRTPSDSYGNMTSKKGISKDMYAAVIANENKLVKMGSHVKIRIGEDMVIDGLKLPKNSIVTGVTSINRERLAISITSVKIGNETKAVRWTVYDQDGNEGIAIPPSILNNIARDATGEAIDKTGAKIETNIPVVGGVKVNLKQKTQEVEFVLSSGHRVYIKEKK